jgi:hypothetical protein
MMVCATVFDVLGSRVVKDVRRRRRMVAAVRNHLQEGE